jgi:hypothetical protein
MPLPNQFAAEPPRQDARLTRGDARSDDRLREVAFRSQSVVIARRVAGIVMRVRVPLSSYRGVALLAPGSGALHKIELSHRDPDLSIPLFEAADTTQIASEWRAWAQSLSLPRLVERKPGELAPVDADSGTAPLSRRRGSAVAKRRTRFSRRRKMGALRRLAVAYRDEREIISYE